MGPEKQNELKGNEYIASCEELEIIDAAIAALDRGEIASEAEVEAAFAKFSLTSR